MPETYIILGDKISKARYPSNTPSHFITQLDPALNLVNKTVRLVDVRFERKLEKSVLILSDCVEPTTRIGPQKIPILRYYNSDSGIGEPWELTTIGTVKDTIMVSVTNTNLQLLKPSELGETWIVLAVVDESI